MSARRIGSSPGSAAAPNGFFRRVQAAFGLGRRALVRVVVASRVVDTVPLAAGRDEDRARTVAAMLCEVGVLLIRAGEISEEIQLKLRDIGARHGLPVRSFVVPTGVLVRVGARELEAIDFLGVRNPPLALDQIERLYAQVQRIRAAAVPVDQVLAEIDRIEAMPSRFHVLAEVPGYAILTAGLGLLLHPGPAPLIGYVVLGVSVGTLRNVLGHLPAVATALPAIAACMVTVVSFRWSGPLLGVDPAWMIIPPLIAFLPGASLTMGVMELATSGMVAGVARIAGSVNVLLLLGFGTLLGSALVTPQPITQATGVWGAWAPWLGVVLLGAGFAVGNRAPMREVPWLLVALLLIWAAQSLATGFLTPAFGAFVAGVVLPIIARVIADRAQIPTQVTFLPAFWMIVPGALGLSGVSDLLVGRHPSAAVDLIATATTAVAIALGILIGTGVHGRRDVVTGRVVDDPDRPAAS